MPNHVTIVFDWDDTLGPTSALQAEGSLRGAWSDGQRQLLSQADKWASKALIAAAQHADAVYVLTNGSEGWVDSNLKGMPKTGRALRKLNIPLISARDLYSASDPDPAIWKQQAYDNGDIPVKDRIISYGDARLDGTAPARHCDEAQCKSSFVQFQRKPGIVHLCSQLQTAIRGMKRRVDAQRV